MSKFLEQRQRDLESGAVVPYVSKHDGKTYYLPKWVEGKECEVCESTRKNFSNFRCYTCEKNKALVRALRAKDRKKNND